MRIRRVLVITVLGYLILTAVAAVFLCDGTLHPARRTLTSSDEAQAHEMAAAHQANVQEVAIPSSDRTTLHACLPTPNRPNTNAVILLHGLSVNRVGMTGYAELLLNHHYTILQPDARAHGASGDR